jgi:HK97 family phage portal protein
MGLYEDFQAELARRRQPVQLSWPVGAGAVDPFERDRGHDTSTFSPESYGEYIATSSEVYAAAHLRARQMSRLQARFFMGRGSSKREITTGPAVELLQHVNPFWTLPRLLRMDELSMCISGETFWAVEKDLGGTPREIWWLRSSRVMPVPHERDYLSGFLYQPVSGGPPIPFGADEIVWFRYPNPLDEFSPLSPLSAARLAADTASAMMKSNRNIFANGLQMAAMVVPGTDKVSFTKEQAAELEGMLDTRFKGADKAHKWAVLRFEAQVKEVGITPKDAEFVEGLNLTLRQVCNAFGVPSPLLNDMEHATLANAREFKLLLWEDALQPDAELRRAEIEEQLLPMFGRGPGRATPDHIEWDYSRVPALQESASESWARERQAIEVGALTINEWRKEKGLPEVPWGDVYWAPVNKAPVEDAEPAVAPTAPAPPPAPAEDVAAARNLTHLDARRFLAGAFGRNGHH